MSDKDTDDLLGTGAGKPAAVAKKKAVAKAPAKAVKKAPAAAAPAKKKAVAKAPAKAVKKAPATAAPAKKAGPRKARGDGKYYFPADSKECEVLVKMVAAKVKAPISASEFAEKNKVDLFKVRIAARLAADQKLIKLTKSSGKTGRLILNPK